MRLQGRTWWVSLWTTELLIHLLYKISVDILESRERRYERGSTLHLLTTSGWLLVKFNVFLGVHFICNDVHFVLGLSSGRLYIPVALHLYMSCPRRAPNWEHFGRFALQLGSNRVSVIEALAVALSCWHLLRCCYPARVVLMFHFPSPAAPNWCFGFELGSQLVSLVLSDSWQRQYRVMNCLKSFWRSEMIFRRLIFIPLKYVSNISAAPHVYQFYGGVWAWAVIKWSSNVRVIALRAGAWYWIN